MVRSKNPSCKNPQYATLVEMKRFVESEHVERLLKLQIKNFLMHRYLHHQKIAQFGFTDEIVEFIVMGQINKLFTFREATLEFLCTLMTDATDVLNEIPTTISFRLGGMMHQLSMVDLSLPEISFRHQGL